MDLREEAGQELSKLGFPIQLQDSYTLNPNSLNPKLQGLRDSGLGAWGEAAAVFGTSGTYDSVLRVLATNKPAWEGCRYKNAGFIKGFRD